MKLRFKKISDKFIMINFAKSLKQFVLRSKSLSFNRGQMALMMVLTTLMFLLIMVPVIEKFVQNEGKWSMKARKTSLAFNLAEAGIDRAVWKLTESTDIWYETSTGTISDYNYDKAYSDIESGEYTIEISSHPTDFNKRIIKSVGKDFSSKEFRSIKVIYKNTASADFAIRAQDDMINEGGNAHIEWGMVISGVNIDASGRTYPRYYSAGHVSPQDGGSTLPGTDDLYWWSYYDIPPMPNVDFGFYLASATAAGEDPCGGDYFTDDDRTFKGCNDDTGHTYYITGDLTLRPGKGGNHITGNIIVLGNIIFQGNAGSGAAGGNYDANVPPEAWKEYGNAWSYYINEFDPFCPHATYAAAEAANYLAVGVTYHLDHVILHGFFYTGGSQGLQGGGNGKLHGVLMSGNDASMSTSNFCIYYDDEVAAGVQIKSLNLVRESWHEITSAWPSGL